MGFFAASWDPQPGKMKLTATVLPLVFIPALFGQPAPAASSLALSPITANLGSTVALDLSLVATTGSEPAGLQWTISYPASDMVLANVSAGPSLISAGKSVYCNSRTGTITCLAVGLNSNPILSGVVAQVTFSLASTVESSLLPISLAGTLGVLGDGTPAPIGGASGSVTIGNWQSSVPPYFTDVAPSSPYYTAANLLYAKGITKGCSASPLSFCPDLSLTRGEAATLLIRAIIGDPVSYSATPYFADVPTDHPFFAWIQKLYELGLTSGCGVNPLIFCPGNHMSRREIASFITRGRYFPAMPFLYSTTPYFTDVPSDDPFFPAIQKMTDLGMSGCSPATYCPGNDASRGETALFLVRGLLNQLLPLGTPVISVVSQPTVSRGASAVTVFVIGTNTHFDSSSVLNAGPGILVSGVAAVNAQTLVATLSVSSTATSGPHSLIVTTGSEEAVLPNGLTVQ